MERSDIAVLAGRMRKAHSPRPFTSLQLTPKNMTSPPGVAFLLIGEKMAGKAKSTDSTNTTENGLFAGMTFLFTGKLKAMKRAEAETAVEKLGGKAHRRGRGCQCKR